MKSYDRVKGFIQERISVVKTECLFLGLKKQQVAGYMLDRIIDQLLQEGLIKVYRSNTGKKILTELVWNNTPMSRLKDFYKRKEEEIAEVQE